MDRKGPRHAERAALAAAAALAVGLACPLVALAETGPMPQDGGPADQGIPQGPAVLAAAVVVGAVAYRFPRARRPVAALLVAGGSIVVAFWIIVIGAWSRSTSGGGLPAEAAASAAGVLLVGLLCAAWILLAGRLKRRNAQRE